MGGDGGGGGESVGEEWEMGKSRYRRGGCGRWGCGENRKFFSHGEEGEEVRLRAKGGERAVISLLSRKGEEGSCIYIVDEGRRPRTSFHRKGKRESSSSL